MVCVVCQKSLEIFWNVIESWLKTRNWSNYEDNNFECVVLKENFQNDSNMNSMCASICTDDNRMTKNGNHKKRQLASGGSSSDSDDSKKVKILKGSGNVYLPTAWFKKAEIEEAEHLQLEAEEVEIKNEDEEIEIQDEDE